MLVNEQALRELVCEGMPKMRLSLYQLERLLQRRQPELWTTLQTKEIGSEIYCVQWFVTLFSFDIDSPALYTVWDIFLLRGWKFLFQLSLAILQLLSTTILTLDSESLIGRLKAALRDRLLSHVLHPLHNARPRPSDSPFASRLPTRN